MDLLKKTSLEEWKEERRMKLLEWENLEKEKEEQDMIQYRNHGCISKEYSRHECVINESLGIPGGVCIECGKTMNLYPPSSVSPSPVVEHDIQEIKFNYYEKIRVELGLPKPGFRRPKKLYECEIHLCSFKTTSYSKYVHHMNIHNDIRPFPCPHDWCDYRGRTRSNLFYHLKNTHSRKGYIRKLTEESRVIRRLKSWGLNVDTDVTIFASKHGCLNDTSRSFSRIDIVITDITSCVVILEVDEFSHERDSYNISCELSRMSDINAFLRLNSYTQPIVWLRYNPNGTYKIGNKIKRVSREKRELALKTKIFSMMEPEYVPDGNENIHYLFYPRVSENGPPKILENNEFPECVKNIVSWGE